MRLTALVGAILVGTILLIGVLVSGLTAMPRIVDSAGTGPVSSASSRVSVVENGPSGGDSVGLTEDRRWIRGVSSSAVTVQIIPRRVDAAAIVAAELAIPPRRPAPTSVPPTPTPPPRGPLSFHEQPLGPSVPDRIRRWEDLIVRHARTYNLDPALLAALMQTESGGDPHALSGAGAVGLMQVLHGSFDPEENVESGARILARNLAMFGRVDLALAAYNAGPGNVREHGGIPPFEETHLHVSRTLAHYEAFRA